MSTSGGEQAFENVKKLINDVCARMNIEEGCRLRLSE